MLLAIDVGNTHTVLGLYDGGELMDMWRVVTDKGRTADELRANLAMLFFADDVDEADIDAAALACVVPQLIVAWRKALADMLGCDVLICSAETAGDLFPTDYPNPHEIGSDRVADAIAATALYGAPVIVVDFGTATNIEVIDADGLFRGGLIAPGVETGSKALFSLAAKLSTIALDDPGAAIGRNTEQAVRAGIVYGEADRVDGLVNRVIRELGYEATVVATGGLATTIAPFSSTIQEVNPQLTLEGLRILHEAR